MTAKNSVEEQTLISCAGCRAEILLWLPRVSLCFDSHVFQEMQKIADKWQIYIKACSTYLIISLSTNLSYVSTFTVWTNVVGLMVVTSLSVFIAFVVFNIVRFSAGSMCSYDGSSVDSSLNSHWPENKLFN